MVQNTIAHARLTCRCTIILISPGKLEAGVSLSLVRALEEPAPRVVGGVGCQRQALQAMPWAERHPIAAPPAIVVAAAATAARTSSCARSASSAMA